MTYSHMELREKKDESSTAMEYSHAENRGWDNTTTTAAAYKKTVSKFLSVSCWVVMHTFEWFLVNNKTMETYTEY